MTPDPLVVEPFDAITDAQSLEAWAGCALARQRPVFGDHHAAWTPLELRE